MIRRNFEASQPSFPLLGSCTTRGDPRNFRPPRWTAPRWTHLASDQWRRGVQLGLLQPFESNSLILAKQPWLPFCLPFNLKKSAVCLHKKPKPHPCSLASLSRSWFSLSLSLSSATPHVAFVSYMVFLWGTPCLPTKTGTTNSNTGQNPVHPNNPNPD